MIKSKAQSDCELRKRKLNRMAESVFDKENIHELKSYLETTGCKYYNIRDKGTSMGKFLYKITAEEVLKHSSQYEKFSVYESLAAADETLMLQGEVFISKDFVLTASLSDIKGISNREAMKEPVYQVYDLDLKERREPSVPGLSKVIDYIAEHELIDMVVEFSMFGISVGTQKENLIIWELRNY